MTAKKGNDNTCVQRLPGEDQIIGDPHTGKRIQGELSQWWKKHPELKVGDKVIFKAIEPMKKYRLEIVT